MPHDYVKGSSKSFAAYEYLKDKELQEMPIGLLNIIKSSYGIVLTEEIDHKNSILLERYSWGNLNQAKSEWSAPKDDEYIISVWMENSSQQELPISAE